MIPETQTATPLGGGNSRSGVIKSPPPLPTKKGDFPLLPSAMQIQEVLAKNNFAVIAGVMLVGFSICLVGIIVFVGIVNTPGNTQVAEVPGGKVGVPIGEDENAILIKIRKESERNALAEIEKTKNDEINRKEKLAADQRAAAEKTKNDEINRKEKLAEDQRAAAANAKDKNPKNYGYDRFDPIVELVDNHAFSATKEHEKDIETLASYLGVFGKKYSPANEYLQVRAIYSWITNNIKYDQAALVDGVTRDNDAVQVFKSRKAVCHGQAVLFKAFCDELKIKCHVVNGPVKSRFTEEGKLVEHAWNAVEIHGKWHLLDCTWGCMMDDEKNEVRLDLYTINEFYFLTDPELLILNHFTRDPDWQLLKTPKTLEQFVKDPNYFAKNDSSPNAPLMAGLSLSVFADFVQKNSIDDVVNTWSVFCPIQVIAMPLHGKLEINKKYTFEFKVPANFRMDIQLGKSISQPMIKNKEGNYVAQITLDKVAPVQIVLWDKENKIDGGAIFAEYNFVKKD